MTSRANGQGTRPVTLWRGAHSTRAAQAIHSWVASAKYSDWGCSTHGLHLGDVEAGACRRCVWTGSATVASRDEARPFSGDEGEPRSSRSWPHTRWLNQWGDLHRDSSDQPALIAANVSIWAIGGRVRRRAHAAAVVGQAVEAWTNASGRLHRTGAPALEWEGRAEYWEDGILHRSDGPAILDPRVGVDYWFQGRPSSRQDLWARWTHANGGVALDNRDAQAFLYSAVLSDASPDALFPPLDPQLVAAALRIHPNLAVTR